MKCSLCLALPVLPRHPRRPAHRQQNAPSSTSRPRRSTRRRTSRRRPVRRGPPLVALLESPTTLRLSKIAKTCLAAPSGQHNTTALFAADLPQRRGSRVRGGGDDLTVVAERRAELRQGAAGGATSRERRQEPGGSRLHNSWVETEEMKKRERQQSDDWDSMARARRASWCAGLDASMGCRRASVSPSGR